MLVGIVLSSSFTERGRGRFMIVIIVWILTLRLGSGSGIAEAIESPFKMSTVYLNMCFDTWLWHFEPIHPF